MAHRQQHRSIRLAHRAITEDMSKDERLSIGLGGEKKGGEKKRKLERPRHINQKAKNGPDMSTAAPHKQIGAKRNGSDTCRWLGKVGSSRLASAAISLDR